MSDAMTAVMDFADHLPVLPGSVRRVLGLLMDEEVSTTTLVEAFAEDPSLVSRLLKLANSAYYGLARRVATIQQGLLVLGRRTTYSLVIAAASEDILRLPCEGYLQPAGGLWRHSVAVAHAARLLAERAHVADRDEAFVGGLLHDIGKVVVSRFLTEHAEQVIRLLSDQNEVSFLEIETQVIAIDHATVGAKIAEHWQLPPRLHDTILHHPRPLGAGGQWALPAVVHVANAVALTLGIGLGLDGLLCELQPEAVERLGLEDTALMEVAGELHAALASGG